MNIMNSTNKFVKNGNNSQFAKAYGKLEKFVYSTEVFMGIDGHRFANKVAIAIRRNEESDAPGRMVESEPKKVIRTRKSSEDRTEKSVA